MHLKFLSLRKLHFLFSFALANAVARADGIESVVRLLPSFAAAVVQTLGQERATVFFTSWTDNDVIYLAERLRFADRNATEIALELGLSEDETTVERTYKIFVGTLGEIYGLQEIRNEFRSNQDMLFIDDGALRYGNRSRRPDGVAYRIQSGILSIFRLLESKMAGANVDYDQLRGLLASLQSFGLTINGRHFAPNSIRLEYGGHARRVEDLTFDEFMEVVLIVRSRPVTRRILAQQRQYPITMEEVRRIQARFIAVRNGNADPDALVRAVEARRRVLLQPRIDDLNLWIHRNLRLPSTRATELNELRLAEWIGTQGRVSFVVERYLTDANKNLFVVQMAVNPERVLNRWIEQHEDFPSSHSSVNEELRLGEWVSHQGGQAYVFDNVLTETNRLHFRVRLAAKPEILLNEWMASSGSFPASSSRDWKERLLSNWVANRGGQGVCFNEVLTDNNRRLFRVRMQIEPEAVLNERVQVLEAFPSAGSGSPLEDRALSQWISDCGGQRNIFNNVLMPQNRQFFAVRMAVHPFDVLNEWILLHRQYPRQRAIDPNEKVLGRWISDHNGQAWVYLNVLTPETRASLGRPRAAACVTERINLAENDIRERRQ